MLNSDKTFSRIENVINSSRQSRTFDDNDVGQILSFLAINPCHIGAWLMVMDLAYIYCEYFPKKWTVYYQQAQNLHHQCWSNSELPKIHQRAATIFSHDQLIEETNVAAYKAFDLAPDNWSIVDTYVSRTRPFLDEELAIPLLEKINNLAPDDCNAQYRRGVLLERYAIMCENYEYKVESLKSYQKSLDLGLENHVIVAVVDDVKRAIERLSDIHK